MYIPAMESPRPLSALSKCIDNSMGIVCIAKVAFSLDGVEDEILGTPPPAASGRFSLEPPWC